MMLKKAMITLIILLGISGCLPKPEPRTGDFNAEVIDFLTNEPVPETEILIREERSLTNLEGQFSLAGLPPGEYQIQMTRDWYESKAVAYKHLGKPALVTFYLNPESLPGRIYYSYEEGENREIYELILEDRTIKKVLSLPLSAETNPVWSESGKLAVESTTDKVPKILIYNISNENFEPILLQDSIIGEHPSLDISGTKMAFKSSGKIIKFDLDNNIQLKSYDKAGFNPVISPNGKMVAYASGNYTKLYIDIENSGFYEFIPDLGFKLNNPCWSPDGERIAFEAYTDSEGKRAIYYISVNPISSVMKQLTYPSGEKEQHKHPTWNKDNIIYFSGNIIYSSRSDIYAVSFNENSNLKSNPWILVSKGSGSKLYPCWGQ